MGKVLFLPPFREKELKLRVTCPRTPDEEVAEEGLLVTMRYNNNEQEQRQSAVTELLSCARYRSRSGAGMVSFNPHINSMK